MRMKYNNTHQPNRSNKRDSCGLTHSLPAPSSARAQACRTIVTLVRLAAPTCADGRFPGYPRLGNSRALCASLKTLTHSLAQT